MRHLFLISILAYSLSSCNKGKLKKNEFCDCAYSPSQYNIGNIQIDIPNTFTPNGDAENDNWIIKNIDSIDKFELLIKISKKETQIITESIGYPWDATGVADGSYEYQLKIGGNSFGGAVCVIRGEEFYGQENIEGAKSILEEEFDCLENSRTYYSDPLIGNYSIE